MTVGRFQLGHTGQTFDFDRRLGLCPDCNQVVAFEDFLDPEAMDRARYIRATHKGKPLFRVVEPDYEQYLASQNGFEILELVLALNRRPVCLEYEKCALRPIVLPRHIDDKIAVSLNLGHPWCSGSLRAQSSGRLRMGVWPSTHVYSIHCQLIATYGD